MGCGRRDFKVDAGLLRRGLLDKAMADLPIVSDHVVAIDSFADASQGSVRSRVVGTGNRGGRHAAYFRFPLVAHYPGPMPTVMA